MLPWHLVDKKEKGATMACPVKENCGFQIAMG